MGNVAIEFNNIGKQYRLGVIGTGTLSRDLNRWWALFRGKEDPYLRIGDENNRSQKASSDYVWALKDIDFKVEQGDVVGIIGKNGAGKSTLLKILSRVTSPTIGNIRVKGRIASLLEVGTGFHPEMTGRENVYMNGSIMGMTKTEITRKLEEIVDFAGVEKYIDTPVKRYSSGMTVRLGFSIAAHLEPEILVVDEVLAVGDAEFQKKAIGKMQDVSRGGERTVLFVSHNMAAIRNLCHNGVVLNNGKLDFIGQVDECIDHYMQLCNKGESYTSLADAKREGRCNGKVRFVDIAFLNESDHPISPRCGSYLKIRVKIIANQDVRNCLIGLGIRDMFGNPMMSFPTDMTIGNMSFKIGEHIMDLVIPKLPLTGGSYRISLSAGIDGEFADFLLNTIKFDVYDDDYFGQGRVIAPHLRGKIVLCSHEWSLKS